jgi:hypothetical protein
MAPPLDMLLKAALALGFLALPSAAGQNSVWQPVIQGPGLSFRAEFESVNQHSCVVRFREDRKLRRTTSDLSVTYSFQNVQHSQNYSAHFDARDTDTLYLNTCEFVVSVVATKVRRW